jgi:hypothetical protein
MVKEGSAAKRQSRTADSVWPTAGISLKQTHLPGTCGGLRPIGNAQLAEDATDMCLDSV